MESTGGGACVPPPVPAFVRSPVALDATVHAGAGVIRNAGWYGFAVSTSMVPITLDEFLPAARHYPIVLSCDPAPIPMAALGLPTGLNQYVELDGTWRRNHYVPGWIRRYPFVPMGGEDGGVCLGVDDASNRFMPACREAGDVYQLFDAAGSLSGFALAALRACERYVQLLEDTRTWVDALLLDRQLVERCVARDVGALGGRRLRNFRLIDTLAHQHLPARRVVDWHRRGWTLPTALQIASQHNWPSLRRAA